MAEDRKIFPVGQVLELITGKNDADISSLVSFITGKANLGPEATKAVAPFAYAWLARWYPKFMDMEWKEDQSWEAYLRQVSHILGDKVSIVPISGRMKTLVSDVLDNIADTQDALTRQTETAVKLEKEVKVLEPLKNLLDASQKKNDELEAKIKSMKSEILALNRKALEFEGKVAMNQDELMQSIKDAIKDGLKGVAIASSVATSQPAADSPAETSSPQASAPEDEWGFGSSSSSSDEFGF